jgi:hypothetical protein
MKEGESAFYACDGSGQMMYHRTRGDDKDGLYILSLDDQNDGTVLYNGQQQQEQKRFISVRHVQKKRQQRKSKSLQQGQQGSQRDDQQSDEDYKHEGESVNVEMRMTSQQIQYYDGDQVTGYYDKSAKTWLHYADGSKQKSTRSDKDHSHVNHEGSQVWVDKTGCWSSMPIQIAEDECN